MTRAIAASGAPEWAKVLGRESNAGRSQNIVCWREAWDHAAADAQLRRIDARHRLTKLATERERRKSGVVNCLVKLSASAPFISWSRRLSPAIKAALVEFVRALARIGKGPAKRHGCTGEPRAKRWQNATAPCRAGSCRPGAWPNSFRPNWGPSNW